MQINRFTEIVIFVTSLDFTFFSCIALFIFYFCFSFAYFALFVRMRLGDFASAEATTGFALWIPTTFEKVDETLSVFALLLLFGSSGFVLCCDRGGLLSLRFSAYLMPPPPKKIKKQYGAIEC